MTLPRSIIPKTPKQSTSLIAKMLTPATLAGTASACGSRVADEKTVKKPIGLFFHNNPLAVAGKTHRPFQIGAMPPRRADLRFPCLLHPRRQVAVAVVLLRKDHRLLRPDGLQQLLVERRLPSTIRS